MEIRPIAKIRTKFREKFGIPRQSGIVENEGVVVFEKEFRDPQSLRGLEGFSHLWLLWEFSENLRDGFSPTVRPPRLGGNRRMGVFATRSPFRPNPIGLSCVKLTEIRKTPNDGTVLVVSGADLMDGTPIYDIKPYLPFTDAHPNAAAGFSEAVSGEKLRVTFSPAAESRLPPEEMRELTAVLAQDPRPSYRDDPDRDYFLEYGRCTVTFRVENGLLTVSDIRPTAE